MVDSVQSTVNPADSSSLGGAIRQVLEKFLQNNIDDMLPARVLSYDAETNTARVQPMIRLVDTNDNEFSRGQLTVPVFNIGGGNALLRFNLIENDFGWIKANDRDISLFLESLRESRPNTVRRHQFDDAVFFPDKMRQFTVSDDDSDALAVLQNTDGTVRISLFNDGMVLTGNVLVNGTGRFTGTLHSDVDVTAGEDSISLVEHPHSYIDSVGIAATPTPRNTDPPS